ncbi:MAG: ribonuclease P protein component [Acidobacteriota bacterium]
MFAKRYRLPATIRFIPARFFKTPYFRVKYARNSETVSRYGFVISKAVDKRAVVRNRIRRVFRSCIEEVQEKIVPGYDMLFFLEKGIINKQRQEVLQEVLLQFKKHNLLQ